eukprot:COSAG02_NODE_14580_length_1257_cov_46.085492_1_plen_331_part_10
MVSGGVDNEPTEVDNEPTERIRALRAERKRLKNERQRRRKEEKRAEQKEATNRIKTQIPPRSDPPSSAEVARGIRDILVDKVPASQATSVQHPAQPTNDPMATNEAPSGVGQPGEGDVEDIDVEESTSSQIRSTPQDTTDAEAEQAEEQEREDQEQGVTALEEEDETAAEDPAENEVDADVDRLAAELEKKQQVTTDADRKREAKEREKADKQRETPQKMDEDKEGDAKTRKIRKEAEKVRKQTAAEVDKLGRLLGKMDIDDPEQQKKIADFWDGFGVEEMQIDEDFFYDDQGNFDQGKYDAARDIVKETYTQQMKRLKAATRLLKRLRKD